MTDPEQAELARVYERIRCPAGYVRSLAGLDRGLLEDVRRRMGVAPAEPRATTTE